jgi:acetyl esterase/lipase
MGKVKRRIIDELPLSAAGKLAKFRGEDYNGHPNNKFDLWMAESQPCAPLVIFYHGGGFRGGERDDIYKNPIIDQFLDAGVSFATVDYRYYNQTNWGVRGSLADCVRAIQFIRYHADKYQIDKTRIGAFGISGGAGTALWIAFQPNMALPLGYTDPVLCESTRLSVVGARATQSTYDILKWLDVVKTDDGAVQIDPTSHEWQAILAYAVELYGFDSHDDLYTPDGMRLRRALDMLGLMSRDDPPMWVFNGMEALPLSENHIKHHPCHAIALWERAREVGLEARVAAPALGLTPPCEDMVEFFLWHLLEQPDLCPTWHSKPPWQNP